MESSCSCSLVRPGGDGEAGGTQFVAGGGSCGAVACAAGGRGLAGEEGKMQTRRDRTPRLTACAAATKSKSK